MKRVLKIFLYIIVALGIFLIISSIVSLKKIKRDPNVHYVKSLPGSLLAQTIPPYGIFIEIEFLDEGDGQGSILAHEYIHWNQYQKLGLWKFYFKYYTGYIKHGRFDHPMEEDARQKSL